MKNRICPSCGAKNAAKYLWGMPAFTPKLQKQIESHEIILGGCNVLDGNPAYHCNVCDTDFGGSTALLESSTKAITFSYDIF